MMSTAAPRAASELPLGPSNSAAQLPAILGGRPAVTLDQKQANRWPIITQDDEEAVLRVLRSGELSSGHLPKAMGGYPCPHPELLALECEWAAWMGLPIMDVGDLVPALAGFRFAPNVLTANNGTAAILSGLHAMGIGPGDEVIVPSTTWWSSVLTILHCGGVPIFAETDLATLALDPEDVKRRITPRTKAIVVTHLFGIPAKMDELKEICQSHGLKLMEDASHAHGATYKGKKIGSIGDCAVFSLQVNKLLPSAEGGILVAQDPEFILDAARLGQYERLVPLKAIDHPHARFAATGFGYKFRMSPISAAIARAQLAKMDQRTAQRTANCVYLSTKLEALGFETFMSEAGSDTQRVYFEFLIRYDASKFGPGAPSSKDLAKALAAEGCEVSAPRYPLLHQQPVFVEDGGKQWKRLARVEHLPNLPIYDPSDLPRTTAGNGTLLKLPSFPSAGRDLLDQYADAFAKVVAHLPKLPRG